MDTTTSPNDHDQLLCSICLEGFVSPKMIDCHHSFCLTCLISLVQKQSKNNKFKCPLCSRVIRIPDGGVHEFTSNYYIEDKSTKDYCRNHPNTLVQIYCKDCLEVICYKCVLIDHQTHTNLDLELEETRNEIMENLESIIEYLMINSINELRNQSAALEKMLPEIDESADTACSKVDNQVNKVCSEIQTLGEAIKYNIRKPTDAKKATLEKLLADRKELNQQMVETVGQFKTAGSNSPVKNLAMTLKITKLNEQMESRKWDIHPAWKYQYPLFKPNDLMKPIKLEDLGTVTILEESPGFTISCNIVDIEDAVDNLVFSSNHQIMDDLNLCFQVGIQKCVGYPLYLGLYLNLPIKENEDTSSCDVRYSFILIKKSDELGSIEFHKTEQFKPGGLWKGWTKFVTWNHLTDPQNGFLDEFKNFQVRVTIRVTGLSQT